jgi:carbohydrate binding protein with CBM6 domain/phospholipase D-like protein
MRRYPSAILALLITVAVPLSAAAQAQVQVPPPERLCDPQFEDCREPVLNLIRNEQMGIDVGFWYMQDARYANELVKRWQAGVPIRILVDSRANKTYPGNPTQLATLAEAGIPMREKFGEDILHNKMMLFHGQNMVEFSKANYDPFAYAPEVPDSNYEDEAVYFTNDDRITNSFRRRFDDRWVDTSLFRNYANIIGPLVRSYPLYSIDPTMNFSSGSGDFSARVISRMDREMQSIDAIVFRVTEDRMADAVIRAVGRGVPVRLITEPGEYRNPKRIYDSKEVDRMYMGGADIKWRAHEGLTHEALIVLTGLGEVIFGSANWTLASAVYQDEHNFFYNPSFGKPWFFQWFVEQFEGKWTHPSNFVPFQPLPPDAPLDSAPSNGASGLGSSVTLTWDGGPWSHKYDVYLGTSSDPPLVAGNVVLGSPDPGVLETYTASNLQPGTTYYWRIVDRTYADMTSGGAVWTFTTAGTPTGGGSTPFRGTPWPVPGTIQAEDFDNGGQSVAYFDTAAGNKGGVYRTDDVDIQATTDAGAGFNVGWTKASEWLKYTVAVGTTDTYNLEVRVAQLGTGTTFHVEVDSVDKTGRIAVPDTGGWQVFQTLTIPGVSMTAGGHVLRLVIDTAASGGAGNYNWLRLSVGSAPKPTLAWQGTPAPLPGTVHASNFDTGGEGVSYHDSSAGNTGGQYRRDTDVDIAANSDPSSNGFYLGWARVGEWVTYTVNVPQSRNYAASVRVANLGSGATFRLEVDGTPVTGNIALPNTGAWDAWATLSLGDISLSQGQHALRIVMVTSNVENNGVGNYEFFQFQ